MSDHSDSDLFSLAISFAGAVTPVSPVAQPFPRCLDMHMIEMTEVFWDLKWLFLLLPTLVTLNMTQAFWNLKCSDTGYNRHQTAVILDQHSG